MAKLGRQCGPVVRVLAVRVRGFKARSDHSLNLIMVVPGSTFRSHLEIANWFASVSLIVSLTLRNPYGEWSIKCVLWGLNPELFLENTSLKWLLAQCKVNSVILIFFLYLTVLEDAYGGTPSQLTKKTDFRKLVKDLSRVRRILQKVS